MSIYWDNRYKSGTHSGNQSHREWEHMCIDKHITDETSVLDVGCGDLAFWDGKLPRRYFGVDISPTIIQNNRKCHPD